MNDDLPDRLMVYKARSSANGFLPATPVTLTRIPRLTGAEGSLYVADGNRQYCAKIFSLQKRAHKQNKLNALFEYLRHRINDPIPQHLDGRGRSWKMFLTHNVAYPRARVYRDPGGTELIGYFMNYFDPQHVKPFNDIINDPGITHDRNFVSFLLQELTYSVLLLHVLGIALGDLSAQNILVRRRPGPQGSRIILIDIDSAQLTIPGRRYANDVWPATTKAPEISVDDRRVTEQTLVFSLSVLVYRALMKGVSPFNFVNHPGDETECVRKGLSPLRNPKLTPAAGQDTALIPHPLRRVLAQGIDPKPAHRPSLGELLAVLGSL